MKCAWKCGTVLSLESDTLVFPNVYRWMPANLTSLDTAKIAVRQKEAVHEQTMSLLDLAQNEV